MSQITFAAILVILMIFQMIWENPVNAREITVNVDRNDTEDCLEGNYPCSSLGYVLNHLQSNDCVNITSNSVPLTTIVELHNLNAITIRGQGNTIVMCNNTGGVSCNNCSNVVIEGITWDGCGDPQRPDPTTVDSTGGLTFTNITNLCITNCILQNSKVHALYLHMVAGVINITGTQILNNSNYDTVFCLRAQSEYIRCFTSNYSVTGGIYIEEASAETDLHISNCTYANNGHFGNVDTDSMTVEHETGEIADGSAVKIFHSNFTIPFNIAIKHTIFLYNRGRSGGAININSTNSPSIGLHYINFSRNSVVRSYVNSSALMIELYSISPTTLAPVINMSFCSFVNNSDGRNVIGLIMVGEPADLLMTNCDFVYNKMYEVGLLELNMQSPSTVGLMDSNFCNNFGSSLLFLQLRSPNLGISLHNIQAINNIGTSVVRRGGLLVFRVSEDNIIVNISNLAFLNNTFERQGGGLYINGQFYSSFKLYLQDSHFENNVGQSSGTILFSHLTSDNPYLIAIYNSSFTRNSGGTSIVRIRKQSLMEDLVIVRKPAFLLLGLSTNFSRNSGGAVSISNAILVGTGNTTFESNVDNNGAALFMSDAYILPGITIFQFNFTKNYAFVRGGAIYIDLSSNSNVIKCNWLLQIESAQLCDQATIPIADGCPVIDGKFLCHEITPQSITNTDLCNYVFLKNNASLAGNVIYYRVPELPAIENALDPNSVFYIPKSNLCGDQINNTRDLSTQPFKLRLNEPARCIDMNCTTYCVNDTMLGEVMEIPAQVVGYNNESTESTIFFVECIENCTNYNITGNNPILINDMFRGIVITGIQNGPPLKLQLMSTTITLDLVIEVIPCRSGYIYNKLTMQCVCYTTDGIVSCTPEPTIKRDYWFGMVDNTTTVSRCPYTYCNFRRREVSPGRFVLPSVQNYQCDSHRTGPACGSCDDGYTIPFDSVECINVDDCHPGYTVLVIIGVMAYWVIVIVVAFLMMVWLHHIKYTVGYLYGIVYYYSVVDALLEHVINRSNGLSLLVSIFGGTVFKLYPGFLFRMCFVKGMLAIDQSVIRYAHPTAVLVLIWLLTKLARHSKRFTVLIHKAAIHTICLILILAYVSIVNTSLQLLRYIHFNDVNAVYSWLSPSIEYFTGRHIVYFMIAVLYELVIGVGLPLLLLLEPFVNHKINFTRINLQFTKLNLKPLLDQFQGCYKDKFRWFASIYLISRQLILIITVIDFTNAYITQYLLMIAFVIISLLHYFIQPYKSNMLNKYDGIILHSLLLIVSLQTIAYSNGFTTEAITGITYMLYFFPILVTSLFIVQYIYRTHHIVIANRVMKYNKRSRVLEEVPTTNIHRY